MCLNKKKWIAIGSTTVAVVLLVVLLLCLKSCNPQENNDKGTESFVIGATETPARETSLGSQPVSTNMPSEPGNSSETTEEGDVSKDSSEQEDPVRVSSMTPSPTEDRVVVDSGEGVDFGEVFDDVNPGTSPSSTSVPTKAPIPTPDVTSNTSDTAEPSTPDPRISEDQGGFGKLG